jgi:hypothetical protein
VCVEMRTVSVQTSSDSNHPTLNCTIGWIGSESSRFFSESDDVTWPIKNLLRDVVDVMILRIFEIDLN